MDLIYNYCIIISCRCVPRIQTWVSIQILSRNNCNRLCIINVHSVQVAYLFSQCSTKIPTDVTDGLENNIKD